MNRLNQKHYRKSYFAFDETVSYKICEACNRHLSSACVCVCVYQFVEYRAFSVHASFVEHIGTYIPDICMSNLVRIFVSSTYLTITDKREVAFGCVLVYMCKNV